MQQHVVQSQAAAFITLTGMQRELQGEASEREASERFPGILAKARLDWADDFEMQLHQVRAQLSAVTAQLRGALRSNGVPRQVEAAILLKARADWHDDYEMQNHCINQQTDAYLELVRIERDARERGSAADLMVLSMAIVDWPNDYEMQLHQVRERIAEGDGASDPRAVRFDGLEHEEPVGAPTCGIPDGNPPVAAGQDLALLKELLPDLDPQDAGQLVFAQSTPCPSCGTPLDFFLEACGSPGCALRLTKQEWAALLVTKFNLRLQILGAIRDSDDPRLNELEDFLTEVTIPPPAQCPTCGETTWEFTSLSPNRVAAKWKCAYCEAICLARAT